ncbi:MAG TPA: hypothetical protein PK440_21935, partial [Candidatus Accumulibacter phosphatis]|nr:hypothetical protein [Candidatus Accumulibacter phosphatis]
MERACRLAIVCAALVILAASALAKTPSDVADLVGAKGAGGEPQLDRRGYEWARTFTVPDTGVESARRPASACS